MKYLAILKASQTAAILAVIENLPVDANGYFLNDEQMTNIEAALVAGNAAIENAATITEQLAQANTARQTAESALATANTTIEQRDATIAQLQTQLTEAQKRPANDFQNTSREKDTQGSGKSPFHSSDDNPANLIADTLLGKPKPKDS